MGEIDRVTPPLPEAHPGPRLRAHEPEEASDSSRPRAESVSGPLWKYSGPAPGPAV
ncbi:hypothetical protein JB92DRAFT_2975538 [Gautieria morchelliformis]|nr:hypothetical protein JB92DRAFT_2975538 [Gautieria morchelliformis]